MERTITCTVNGGRKTVATHPDRTLLEVLREDWGLTGAKRGCGEGHCGACTVLLDGKQALACTTRIGEVEGKSVVTIEGLVRAGALHPVQEAFLEANAFQCGYCTPGMIMGTVALLQEKPSPSDPQIVSWFQGHICRCCGYARLMDAVRLAARKLAAAPAQPLDRPA